MGSITINGMKFEGQRIELRGGTLTIDGNVVDTGTGGTTISGKSPDINIVIDGGTVENIVTDGNLQVIGDVDGDVNCSGNMMAKNVSGEVNCGGNLSANAVAGNVNAGGNVTITKRN